MLSAVQEGVAPDPGASFAGSTPGTISLEAGNKYSRIRIRAERWDGRPPPTDDWEDVDDIPFEEVSSAGKLVLSGFDTGEVGLDISGLGRGRVQVFARGRHRYHYGSHNFDETLDPEEWLLRLYPHDGPIEPMAGGPRRIAGGGGLSRTTGSPWLAAVRGFRTSGWDSVLSSSHAFYLANLALLSTEGPLTRLDLAAQMARRMPPWELGGPDSESLEVPPRPSSRGELDPLARLSGRPQVDTIGAAIDALVSIGLLLVEERHGVRLLVPNPAPESAWERVGMTGEALAGARSRALENEHRGMATNIAYAVAWRGDDGLTATPRAMAIRWCTTVDDAIGGLRLLGGSGRVRADPPLEFDSEIDPDSPLTLWRGYPPAVVRSR
jgi:hypothetical protein